MGLVKFVYTIEYTMHQKEKLMHTTVWMSLKNSWAEVKQESNYCMVPFIWCSRKHKNNL